MKVADAGAEIISFQDTYYPDLLKQICDPPLGCRTRIAAGCAVEQGNEISAAPGNVTNRDSWGLGRRIKQGAKLTATCDHVWEELPTDLNLQLEPGGRVESAKPVEASLFADSQLSPHERRVYALLKPDEAVQLDQIIEQLEGELLSSEIFSAVRTESGWETSSCWGTITLGTSKLLSC